MLGRFQLPYKVSRSSEEDRPSVPHRESNWLVLETQKSAGEAIALFVAIHSGICMIDDAIECKVEFAYSRPPLDPALGDISKLNGNKILHKT